MLRGAEAENVRARVSLWLARLGQSDRLPALVEQPVRVPSTVRWNPGRTGLLSMLAVAVLALLVAGWWLLRSQPHRLAPVRPASVSGSGGASAQAPGGSLAAPLARAGPTTVAMVVDVVGKVRHPGVYRLDAGSRVVDAIKAAGGALPGVDLSSINLARKVTDGEQVAVAVHGAASGAVPGEPGGGATGNGSSGGLLDLNTATLSQLDTLPGVGPVLAQQILDWRIEHGRFDSVDQLRSVSGLGDSKFATLRPLVVVQ